MSRPTKFPAALAVLLLAPLTVLADAGGGEGANLVLFFGRFHPLVLHLPVGMLTAAVLLEAFDIWRPRRLQPIVTTALTGMAAASAILAVTLGLMLEQSGGYDEETVNLHKWITIAMTVLVIAAFILKLKVTGPGKIHLAYRLCLFGAIALMGPGGHEGGNLTHGKTYLTEHMPDPPKSIVEKLMGIAPAQAPGDGYYATHVYPIFKEKCYSCHAADKQKGDYRLDTKAGAFAAGESEVPGIVPGMPMKSMVVELITLPSHADDVMPPDGKTALTQDEILTIIHWIADGAEWPDSNDQAAIETAPAENTPETAKTDTAPESPAESADSATEPAQTTDAAAPAEVDYKAVVAALKPGVFRDQIFPILERSCIECHGPEKQKGKLRLDTPEWIEKGVKGEPVIVAGKPDDSTFYTLVTLPEDDDDVMPPEGKGEPLTQAEKDLFKQWILDGADFGRP